MDICIFHKNCNDGFASAWIAQKKFPNIVLMPYSHGMPLTFLGGGFDNKEILICDFSFPPIDMRELCIFAKSVTLLDHHKSAFESLKDFHHPKLTKIFDMNRSGAMLTWNHLYPKKDAPRLIHYVQDYDLWKFEVKHTKEIMQNVSSFEKSFEVWDDLAERCEVHKLRDKLVQGGKAILRKQQQDIASMIPFAQKMFIGHYEVPVLNVPFMLSSEAGHLLCEKLEPPFAATYYDAQDERKFSLRSVGDFDVSKIAALFGGGGHRNASGFVVKKSKLSDEGLL